MVKNFNKDDTDSDTDTNPTFARITMGGLLMAYVYIWEFEVHPECVNEFKRLYGPEGPWVQLFRKHAGYEYSLLLNDLRSPFRFVTVDSWESKDAHDAFKAAAIKEFETLDALGESYTVVEREMGHYTTI